MQQHDVGAAQGVGRATGDQLFLDVAHRVVAKVTSQAAAKARQTRPQRHLEALLVSADDVQRVAADTLHHRAVGQHLGHGLGAEAAGTQQGACRQADEAVAAKALAAHHRFQQKAVLATIARMGQLEVQRERGFEVGKGLG